MKITPENTIQKIGFSAILDAALEVAMSDMAREFLESLRPENEFQKVVVRLERTRELLMLRDEGIAPPLGELPDVRAAMNRARPQGSVLDTGSILAVGVLLQTSRRVKQFFRQREEGCPHWYIFADHLHALKVVEDEIFRVLTETGVVRDSASPELQQIRRNLNSRRNDLRTALQKVLRQASKDGYLSEQEPTIRGGRMVLAVRAEHKRKLSGFIHDTSATGQTVYLEPVDALHINNDIRQLENEEQREIERILKVLTAQIREHITEILTNASLLAELDAAMAVSRVSETLHGIIPEMIEPGSRNSGQLRFVNARNPHLYLRAVRAGASETVVPLQLELDAEELCVVITGPNAGGKSVAMKTVGLISMMAQCGFAVPAEEGTRLPVWSGIFVDMGDEQSIDNDLSTFSSRLDWMQRTAKQADEKSLILIDEAGTGTDPEEGVALYQSLLEHLIERKCRIIVTTHHGNLKVFAHNHSGTVNASMEFDQKTLSPTYRFRKGLPGSSYAFEIAGRMGVPDGILLRSRELLGDTRNRLEHLIAELERMSQDVAADRNETQRQLREARKLISEYDQKYQSLMKERDAIREKALIEARDIMQSANKRVEEAVRRIAEEKAGKKEVREIRKDLETSRNEVNRELEEIREERKPKPTGTPPKVGDTVKLADGDSIGELIEVNGNRAVVMVNGLTLKTSYKNLVKVQAQPKREPQVRVSFVGSSDDADDGVIRRASPTLDIRGKRGEEAIHDLTHHIDRAVGAGLTQLEIIHGKGDGILRKLVHNHLSGRKEVKEFALAPWEQGGPGCTLVFLK